MGTGEGRRSTIVLLVLPAILNGCAAIASMTVFGGALGGLSGTSHRPPLDTTLSTGDTLRIVFGERQTLALERQDRHDTLAIAGAKTLHGRLTRKSADTLWLSVTRVETLTGAMEFAGVVPPTVSLTTGRAASITRRSQTVGRSRAIAKGAIIGAIIGAVPALVLALIAAN